MRKIHGTLLFFSIHEPSSYKYLHVLLWFCANPSSNALNCLGHHWHDETPCLDAWSHSPRKGKYFGHLMQSHAIMMWHGQWVEFHILLFHWWFLTLHHPFGQVHFSMGAFEIKGWLWSFSSSTLGEVSSNVKIPPMLTTHGSSMSSSLGSSSLDSLS